MSEQQQPKYQVPIYRASGKGSFFEVFDSLAIGKIKLAISLYDEQTHKSTGHAEYFLDYAKAWAFCEMVKNGYLEDALNSKDGFPSFDYGIPGPDKPKMREFRMSPRSEKNRNFITITEKERKDRWDTSAPDLAKAQFIIAPLELLQLAKMLDWYINTNLAKYPNLTEGMQFTEQ